MLNLVCRRISIVFAFSYGPAKTIRIRHVWMRIYLKTEKKNLRYQKYPDTRGRGLVMITYTIHSRKFGYDVTVRTTVRTFRVGVGRDEFLPSPLESFVPYCFKGL